MKYSIIMITRDFARRQTVNMLREFLLISGGDEVSFTPFIIFQLCIDNFIFMV